MPRVEQSTRLAGRYTKRNEFVQENLQCVSQQRKPRQHCAVDGSL